jgi:hypothetical protein
LSSPRDHLRREVQARHLAFSGRERRRELSQATANFKHVDGGGGYLRREKRVVTIRTSLSTIRKPGYFVKVTSDLFGIHFARKRHNDLAFCCERSNETRRRSRRYRNHLRSTAATPG